MPIIQLNLWVCEKCDAIATTSEETDIYSDPVVYPPTEGWGYRVNPKELDQLLCPGCMSDERE